MDCYYSPTSTCLCGCDCEFPTICTAPVQTQSIPREPPHEPCCCCSYNPFADENNETEILDLGFARRKLTMMKCQMKKWRMERLQLESETRSLKQTLQSLGIKVEDSLKPDPLIIHYRKENIRLEMIKEQLEEKIRNLEDTLVEHDLYENPCEGVEMIREKIRALREQSSRDKKKLRLIIMELKIKLEEAEDETSCAGVNRLRTKLRRLMNKNNGVDVLDDQGSKLIVKKSGELVTELSKSCDNLKLQYELLRNENEDLRRVLKHSEMKKRQKDSQVLQEVKTSVDDEIADDTQTKEYEEVRKNDSSSIPLEENVVEITSEIKKKLSPVESVGLVGDRTKKKKEGDGIIIEDFRKKPSNDIDKMTISHKALLAEVVAVKEELKRREQKLSELLNQLRQSSLDMLGMSQLQREIESSKTQLDDRKIERDKLFDELHNVRLVLAARSDQIIKILERRGESINYSTAKEAAALQDQIDAPFVQVQLSRKKISTPKGEIDEAEKHDGELRQRISQLKEKNLESELPQSRTFELEDDLQKTDHKLPLNEQNKQLNDSISELKNKIKNSENDLNNTKVVVENLKQQLQTCENNRQTLNESLTLLKVENDLAKKEYEKCKKEIERLKSIEQQNQMSHDRLLAEHQSQKAELIAAHTRVTDLNDELTTQQITKAEVIQELDTLKGELKVLITKLDEMSKHNSDLKSERDDLKNELIALNEQLVKSVADNNALNQAAETTDTIAITAQLENDKFKKNIAELTEDVDHWKLENCKTKLDIDKLTAELELCRNNVTELEKQLAYSQSLVQEFDDVAKARAEAEIAKTNALTRNKNLEEELQALKGELTKYRNDNEIIQKDIDDLNREHMKLNKESDNLKLEITALRNRNEILNNENEQLKNDSAGAKGDYLGLKSVVETLKIDNATLKGEGDRLRAENSDMNSEVNDLKKANDNLLEELATWKFNHEVAEKENRTMVTTLTELKANLTSLEPLKKDLETSQAALLAEEARVHTLQANFNVLNEEKASLVAEISTLRTNLEALKKELDYKNDQIKDLETIKDELNSIKNELIKSRDDKLKLQCELDPLKKQLEIFKNENQDAQREVANIIQQEKAMKIDKEKLINQLNKLEFENKKLNTDREVLNKSMEESNEQFKNLESERDKLKKKLSDSKAQVDSIKVGATPKNAAVEELSALKNTLGNLKRNLDNCNIENDQLQSELDKMRNDNIKLETKLDEMKKAEVLLLNEVKGAQSEIEHLNKQMSESQSTGNRFEQNLEKSQSEVVKMKNIIENLKLERDQLKKNIETMELATDKFHREPDEMAKSKNIADNDVNKWTKEVEYLRTENNDMNNDLEATRNDLNKLKRDSENTKAIMLEEVERLKKEIERLKNDVDTSETENMNATKELKSVKDNLNNVGKDAGKITTTEEIVAGKMSQGRSMVDELYTLENKLQQLKQENDKLKIYIKKLEKDLHECQVEKDECKRELLTAMTNLNIIKDSTKTIEGNVNILRDSAQPETLQQSNQKTLPFENDKSTIKLEPLNTNFDKDPTSSAHSEQKSHPEDHAGVEIVRLRTAQKSWNNENEILNSNEYESLKRQKALDELNSSRRNAKSLKIENKQFKRQLDSEQSDENSVKQLANNSEDKLNLQTSGIANELIRAIDVLRMKTEMPMAAVERIRSTISQIKEHGRPAVSKFFMSDDLISFESTNPIIVEIHELFDDLTANILMAESELEGLGEAWKASWNENTNLRKLVENSGAPDIPAVFKLPEHESAFHPENWLQSLTLTQLADLHDQICSLTANLVQQDINPAIYSVPNNYSSQSKKESDLQQSYDNINRKIAALQRQIAERQSDADRKVLEMRQTLGRAQAELIRIWDKMNKERKRNLMLHLTMDGGGPCWVNNCKAKCAENVNYILNVRRKK